MSLGSKRISEFIETVSERVLAKSKQKPKRETAVVSRQTFNGRTKFLALLGKDLSFSPSPQLHNTWLQEEHLNGVYLPFPFDNESSIHSFLTSILACPGFSGANITLPYKTTVVGLGIAEEDSRVKTIGAANTIYRNRLTGQWILTNTDVDGINASISEFITSQESSQVLILGAGGAAAAAAHSVLSNAPKTEIVVCSRSPERRHPSLRMHNMKWRELEFHEIQKELDPQRPCLVINTLPFGHRGEENPVAQLLLTMHLVKLRNQTFYFDMVYRDTPAIELAKKLNVPHLNGWLMLETQARRSFELWKDNLECTKSESCQSNI